MAHAAFSRSRTDARRSATGIARAVRFATRACIVVLAMLHAAPAHAAAYAPDPTYNNGLIGADAFAGSFSRNYIGKKLVRLDNGDIIVAGLVPKFESGSNLVNVGLVRYNASGTRMPWSNPTPAFAFFGNQYLIYPNRDDASAGNDLRIDDIKDMTLFGDRIFVLVDGYFQNFAGPYIKRGRVLSFRTDGQFLAAAPVGPGDVLPGGIALYDNGVFPTTVSLVFAGYTRPDLGISRPVYARYTVAANGALTETASMNPLLTGACPANRSCEIHGVALGGSINAPRVYLAGTSERNTTGDWDFLAIALNTNGTAIASFGDGGSRMVPFDVGGDRYDRANDIVVDRGFGLVSDDQIYLVGDVEQDCKQGAGIAKLTHDGDLDTSFGQSNVIVGRSGKHVIGGSDANLCVLNAPATTAAAAALADNRLAITGHEWSPSLFIGAGNENIVNGMAIVLSADSGDAGNIVSHDIHPYTDTVGGPRTRHAAFTDIVASGSGRFTVAGSARYFQASAGAPSGANQYATLRLRYSPVLFADGFETD